ncbi:conserved domain protein [gamma proteobacterium NOR5-3]|nr:DsrE family protein [Congregibacter sp.]EED33587.1 conserved domain protein [gamma proteobacterium NOR5-3]MDA8961842.1 DsrE family protein [Congregibacter sp.]
MRVLSLAIFFVATLMAPLFAGTSYGQDKVVVTPTMELPADGVWMHAFDSIKGESGQTNAALARAVALYKHLEKAGIDPKQVTSAVVVHGPAIYDIANASRYEEAYGEGVSNPNAELVAELVARGGEIWVCGVAALHRGVGDDDVLPGVQMAPAAMVAHAELQRRGFSLNPY